MNQILSFRACEGIRYRVFDEIAVGDRAALEQAPCHAVATLQAARTIDAVLSFPLDTRDVTQR